MSDIAKEFGIGVGDENVGKKVEAFKAEGGRVYRVSFGWWPGSENLKPDLKASSPRFLGSQRHYAEGCGYILHQGPEYTKLLGQPKHAIATILVVWPTDAKGNLRKDHLDETQVLPWVFSEDKYTSFSPLHSEFHFGTCDMRIACTDTKFQKMTFSLCKESILAKLLAAEKQSPITENILAEVKRIADGLQDRIGRALTLDQVKEKLTGGAGGPVAGATSMSDQDVDKMVEDLVGVTD